MARLSGAVLGEGGVKPISDDTNAAVPSVFLAPGTGLKNSTRICGVVGCEVSSGDACTIEGDEIVSGLVLFVEVTGETVVVASVEFVAAATSLVVLADSGAGALVPVVARNDFQFNKGGEVVVSSNRSGTGPTVGR